MHRQLQLYKVWQKASQNEVRPIVCRNLRNRLQRLSTLSVYQEVPLQETLIAKRGSMHCLDASIVSGVSMHKNCRCIGVQMCHKVHA